MELAGCVCGVVEVCVATLGTLEGLGIKKEINFAKALKGFPKNGESICATAAESIPPPELRSIAYAPVVSTANIPTANAAR